MWLMFAQTGSVSVSRQHSGQKASKTLFIAFTLTVRSHRAIKNNKVPSLSLVQHLNYIVNFSLARGEGLNENWLNINLGDFHPMPPPHHHFLVTWCVVSHSM